MGLKVHHLNCASFCPRLPAPLRRGMERLVSHCLLIELADGLALIDTGFGTADVAAPGRVLDASLRAIGRPAMALEETAIHQVRALGYAPADVRHIVVTHLDLDHAGGLGDFPHATVHLLGEERAAARARRGLMGRRRYVPDQWAHGPRWRTYAASGEAWNGFQAARQLRGLPPEMLLIPLQGHTLGHAGVAVRGSGGWMLHAGDAYFHRSRLTADGATPFGLRVLERAVATDPVRVRANRARLAGLVAGGQVRVFCAHDPAELAHESGRDGGAPLAG